MGIHSLLAILSALAGATWLGAMVYSLAVLLHEVAEPVFFIGGRPLISRLPTIVLSCGRS